MPDPIVIEFIHMTAKYAGVPPLSKTPPAGVPSVRYRRRARPPCRQKALRVTDNSWFSAGISTSSVCGYTIVPYFNGVLAGSEANRLTSVANRLFIHEHISCFGLRESSKFIFVFFGPKRGSLQSARQGAQK